MKQRTRATILAVLLAGIVARTGPAEGGPLAGAFYFETDLGGGSWQYDYTFTNSSDPGYDLYDVYFDLNPSVTMGIGGLPFGWDGFGDLGVGEVFSLDSVYDVLPGHSLNGFRFTFDAQVGPLQFTGVFTNPDDPLNPTVVAGLLSGPAASAVPEPSIALLLGTGLASTALLKRRRAKKRSGRVSRQVY